ncbi:endonuclease domain-containing protein (plasmid) [Coraliomargarita sp. W4R53]
MNIAEWLSTKHQGVAHRQLALRAGFKLPTLRAAATAGSITVLRRTWLALPSASGDRADAAKHGARVACVSAARARGWWLPDDTCDGLHLGFAPHARSGKFEGVAHWTKPLAPGSIHDLIESPEDALAHVATCVDPEAAIVVWESAIRTEGLSVEALRAVSWISRAAQDCAARVNGLSDSGLETIMVVRLSGWGIPIRQQIVIAGHRVDLLIGERLIIQVDGFAHHSSSAQRSRDVAHDAELRLREYTVLRFTYAQVIHDWIYVERTIARAIAVGAHLPR